MRIYITLEAERTISIPVNYQEYLTAAVYGYVGAGDSDYARFVHDDGYAGPTGKRYKPFTHSWLRMPGWCRRVIGDRMQIQPGPISWQVSSPLDDFLRPFANGLVKTGTLRIGSEILKVQAVEAVGPPDLSSQARCRCLSPIVATTKREDGGTQYLRPADNPQAYSEAIRKNLIAKYVAINNTEPNDQILNFAFDTQYLSLNHGGTKKTTFKGIDVIGVLAPFTVSGSPELIQLGLEAGFGGKTACGFGCAESAA